MPNFDIIREIKPKKTFRVASVMGTYDLQTENIQEHFCGNIALPEQWTIGLIVGNSGTGKTTIAKELFPDAYITEFKYTHETILDDMPKNCSVNEIMKAFNCVGFSTPLMVKALFGTIQWRKNAMRFGKSHFVRQRIIRV